MTEKVKLCCTCRYYEHAENLLKAEAKKRAGKIIAECKANKDSCNICTTHGYVQGMVGATLSLDSIGNWIAVQGEKDTRPKCKNDSLYDASFVDNSIPYRPCECVRNDPCYTENTIEAWGDEADINKEVIDILKSELRSNSNCIEVLNADATEKDKAVNEKAEHVEKLESFIFSMFTDKGEGSVGLLTHGGFVNMKNNAITFFSNGAFYNPYTRYITKEKPLEEKPLEEKPAKKERLIKFFSGINWSGFILYALGSLAVLSACFVLVLFGLKATKVI